MHAVVNFLTFAEPIDPELFPSAERDLAAPMQAIPGFEGMKVVQTSETEAILLIFGDSGETLNRIATEVGSPWMVANVVPKLAGPPQRHLGAIVANITPA